jgi:hypothetical protein
MQQRRKDRRYGLESAEIQCRRRTLSRTDVWNLVFGLPTCTGHGLNWAERPGTELSRKVD